MRAFLAIDTAAGPAGEPATGPAAPSHLTLRFFGEISPEGIAQVIGAVGPALRPVAPFELGSGSVGAFPSSERPRIVWLGLGRGEAEVRDLVSRIDAALATVGLPPAREPFVPHVTLLRVRSPRDLPRARALLEGRVAIPTFPPVAVRAVLLKESRLTAGGPRHTVVHAFPLAAGP